MYGGYLRQHLLLRQVGFAAKLLLVFFAFFLSTFAAVISTRQKQIAEAQAAIAKLARDRAERQADDARIARDRADKQAAYATKERDNYQREARMAAQQRGKALLEAKRADQETVIAQLKRGLRGATTCGGGGAETDCRSIETGCGEKGASCNSIRIGGAVKIP